MKTTEIIDRLYEMEDALQQKAQNKRNIEQIKHDAYKEGYDQACEDFARWIKQELPIWLREAKESED